jgi:hypothetical protein
MANTAYPQPTAMDIPLILPRLDIHRPLDWELIRACLAREGGYNPALAGRYIAAYVEATTSIYLLDGYHRAAMRLCVMPMTGVKPEELLVPGFIFRLHTSAQACALHRDIHARGGAAFLTPYIRRQGQGVSLLDQGARRQGKESVSFLSPLTALEIANNVWHVKDGVKRTEILRALRSADDLPLC